MQEFGTTWPPDGQAICHDTMLPRRQRSRRGEQAESIDMTVMMRPFARRPQTNVPQMIDQNRDREAAEA